MRLTLIPRLNYKYRFSDLLRSRMYPASFESSGQVLLKFFGTSDVFFLDSARNSILLALRSSGLPSGTSVGVTGYNCHTVFNAVRLAGFRSVFIDILDDFTIDLKDLGNKQVGIKALIVTHLFGRVSDVGKIKSSYPGLLIIEDCAHAFLSQYPDGTCAGSKGDFAVFSFNHAKFPAIGGGGALVVNNSECKTVVSENYSQLDTYSRRAEICNFEKKLLFAFLHRPFIYNLVTYRLKQVQSRQKRDFLSENFVPVKMSSADLRLLNLMLIKMPQILSRQRDNAAFILSALHGLKIMMPENSNCFMIPYLAGSNRQLYVKRMLKAGVETGPHFADSLNWASSLGYEPGSCPNAERIAESLIVIPCYYSLSVKQVTKIALALKKSIQ